MFIVKDYKAELQGNLNKTFERAMHFLPPLSIRFETFQTK